MKTVACDTPREKVNHGLRTLSGPDQSLRAPGLRVTQLLLGRS
jgi:hypothetical protein